MGESPATRSVEPRIKLVRHELNQGKGAALRTGIAHATSEIVIIQDADVEYDPNQYYRLIAPILSGKADVVFGSRFQGGSDAHRVLYFWHSVGNKFLTLCSNMATDLNLTDMEVCYKAFRREVIQRIRDRGKSFRFRAGNHGQSCQVKAAHLRGRHFLQRSHLCRRKEDRLARWLSCTLVHLEI